MLLLLFIGAGTFVPSVPKGHAGWMKGFIFAPDTDPIDEADDLLLTRIM